MNEDNDQEYDEIQLGRDGVRLKKSFQSNRPPIPTPNQSGIPLHDCV